jgi:hypothetical protein
LGRALAAMAPGPRGLLRRVADLAGEDRPCVPSEAVGTRLDNAADSPSGGGPDSERPSREGR